MGNIDLSNYIKEDNVLFLKKDYKHKIINHLIEKAFEKGFIKDIATFKTAIDEREVLSNTGLGNGIAIPHAKLDGIDDFFILIAKIDEGVEWEAIDGKPVSIVLLIGGPNNQQRKYLEILSKLMLILKNEDNREKIMTMNNVTDIVDLFTMGASHEY